MENNSKKEIKEHTVTVEFEKDESNSIYSVNNSRNRKRKEKIGKKEQKKKVPITTLTR